MLAGCDLSGTRGTSGTTATSTGGFPNTSITKASADLCNMLSFAEVSQATGLRVAQVTPTVDAVAGTASCLYKTADNGFVANANWTVFDNGDDAQFNYNFLTHGRPTCPATGTGLRLPQ